VSEPTHAAKFALRSLAQPIDIFDAEIDGLDSQLEQLVAAATPRTTQLLGIPTGHAGQLLITAGENIHRLHGEASFAALCGASPVPASSGKTTRHRLNPGGDRQANRALHLIAVCRLSYRRRTRADAERRTQEGKSQREIMRCLKRYIAREVYNTLQADLNTLRPQQPRSLDHDPLRQPQLRNHSKAHLTSIGTSRDVSRPRLVGCPAGLPTRRVRASRRGSSR
jgi:transposase